MQYLKTKARKIYKLIIEWELRRMILKYTIKNLNLPYWIRQYALLSILFIPIQSSQSYNHLRCFLSNQPRSVLTHFKMNRFRLKYAISQGHITGIKKASW